MARHKSQLTTKTRLRIESLENRRIPTTLIPTTFADGGLGSGSLRDAVLQFNADTGHEDDTIQLLPGRYTLTIRNSHGHENEGLEGDLDLNQTSHRWILQGVGSATVIDASQLQDRVFQIVSFGTQVVFQDLVIQGGLAQDDGTEGALPGTTDALGGGIFNNGGDVTLDNVVLRNNVAKGGIGLFARAGYNARGGGFYLTSGRSTISNSTLDTNQAMGGQGGTGFTVGGYAGDAQGGGVYVMGGSLSITGSALAANQTIGGRGGDALGYTCSLMCGRTTGGSGGRAQGGGLYVNNGLLVISDNTVSTNQATGGSGGDGRLGRGGDGGTAQGAGVYDNGALTVSNSTIGANTVQGGNGGDASWSGGNGGAGQGCALYVVGGFTAHVSFSTIAVNQATGGTRGRYEYANTDGAATGGGIFDQGMLQTDDTILAGNTVNGPGTDTSPDLFGNLGSRGYNLIGNTQGGTGFNFRDLLNIDPDLGSLQDNGGPTQTMALLPGSPALNTGDPGQLGMPDQRGVVRSGGVNIGAYQASATAFLLDAPTSVTAGVPFDVTVTAVDPFSQVAVGYSGTVTFSTTDPDSDVVLPADYTFTLDDGGMHTFTDTGLGAITLVTPGDQVLTVTDTADTTITASATITVEAGGSAPALFGSPRPCGPGTTGDTTPLQNVQCSLANAAVQRFFAALAEEEPMSPWLRWQHREPGEPAEWFLDLRHQDAFFFA
jgi:hypothetical protein